MCALHNCFSDNSSVIASLGFILREKRHPVLSWKHKGQYFNTEIYTFVKFTELIFV